MYVTSYLNLHIFELHPLRPSVKRSLFQS